MAEETHLRHFAGGAACLGFDAELSAYLEGELRPAVPAHAQECLYCRTVLEDIAAIRAASREIPLEEPSPAVWANLRATLAREGIPAKPTRAWARWVQGLEFLPGPAPLAAVASLVFCGVFLLVAARTGQRNLTLDTSSGQIVDRPEEPADLVEVADLSRTIKDMEESYQAHQTSLDPDEKAIFQKSLESLDSSINECRASVEKEPDNDLAHEYLVAAYTQKVEVLESALQYPPR